MRTPRRRAAEHLESGDRTGRSRRARRRTGSGVPKLGLWECGIGAGWK